MKNCVMEILQNKSAIETKEFKDGKEARAYAESSSHLNGKSAYCVKMFVANSDVVVTKTYYKAGSEKLGQVSFKHGKKMEEWTPFSSEAEYQSIVAGRLPVVTGLEKPEAEQYKLFYEDNMMVRIRELGSKVKTQTAKAEKKTASKKKAEYTVIEIMGNKFYLVPVEDLKA